MTAGFMRWFIRADTIQSLMDMPLRLGTTWSCRCFANNPCFAPKSCATTPKWERQQMIVETTCCAREDVRIRSTEAR